MTKRKQAYTVAALVAAIIVIDQIIKLLVKTHMHIGEDIPLIGTWCRLHFIENEGFAFGMAFGGEVGKIILTLFRVIASGLIAWFIVRHIRQRGRTSLIVSLSLILAGAVGNLVDCCFYGLIFNESYYNIATLFPSEGGYAPFLQGKVVDMFYFPLIHTTLPEWLPVWGGEDYIFFSPVFNFADSCITVGFILLLLFYRRELENLSATIKPEAEQHDEE